MTKIKDAEGKYKYELMADKIEEIHRLVYMEGIQEVSKRINLHPSNVSKWVLYTKPFLRSL